MVAVIVTAVGLLSSVWVKNSINSHAQQLVSDLVVEHLALFYGPEYLIDVISSIVYPRCCLVDMFSSLYGRTTTAVLSSPYTGWSETVYYKADQYWRP